MVQVSHGVLSDCTEPGVRSMVKELCVTQIAFEDVKEVVGVAARQERKVGRD